MLELPHVTLLCADTVNHALAMRALERSCADIAFARVVFLTDALPPDITRPPGIEIRSIPPLRSRDDYSQLMLKGLLPHVDTSHVLVVQWDGYVVNAQAWDPAFLDVDYIGAKWFWYRDGHTVGNGGFSLRSRRLLEALQDPRVVLSEAEDITIGRASRPLLEDRYGIRFATEATADRFAFEAAYPIGKPFGFHGLFNFARVVPPEELTALAASLSDDIARSPQMSALLRNCAALGQWDAVTALAQRRLAAQPDDADTRALRDSALAAAARGPVVGRNEPCPCGSGKRYKHCHGAAGATAAAADRASSPDHSRTQPSRPSQAAVDVPALLAAGMASHQRGDLHAAQRAYETALREAPAHPLAMHYLGVLAYQRNDLAAALPLLEASAQAVPDEAEFHNNLGLAFAAADRYDEAIRAHERAVALRPQHALAWNNLGLARTAHGDLEGAEHALRRALAAQADLAPAHWNLALALLARGQYAAGWSEYEWRLAVPEFRVEDTPSPAQRWRGELLHGKRLLVTSEQGLGDTLHFIRYARELAERGAYVVARVPRKLAALVGTVPGVAEVNVRDDAPAPCDFQVPLLSVPGVLGVDAHDVGRHVPYVAVDPAARARAVRAIRATAAGRVAIGLAWSGAQRNTNDRRRSIALATLAPLLAHHELCWFSLQHDDEAAVAAVPDARTLERLPERVAFDGMAAMIDALDVVVTVDTSVAHVAGALGKPVWILLPHAADWRWGLAGTSTPWYPSARLFRQHRPGDWAPVVARVEAALGELRPA